MVPKDPGTAPKDPKSTPFWETVTGSALTSCFCTPPDPVKWTLSGPLFGGTWWGACVDPIHHIPLMRALWGPTWGACGAPGLHTTTTTC